MEQEGTEKLYHEEREYILYDGELHVVGVIEREYDLKKRTNSFAHGCVKLAMSLPGNFLGNHVRRQLIRASTSVAANYRASQLAQSKKGFISKLSIVTEECDESLFWIEFAIDETLVELSQAENLLNEAKELTSIFVKSRMTAQNRDYK